MSHLSNYNFFVFQSKSRPSSQSGSSRGRGNPKSSSSRKKNTADKSDDDIDPEQFAKILELLTNPKLKNILKPEIADALEDNLSVLQKTDSQGGSGGGAGRLSEQPRRNNNVQNSASPAQRQRLPDADLAAVPRAISPGMYITSFFSYPSRFRQSEKRDLPVIHLPL